MRYLKTSRKLILATALMPAFFYFSANAFEALSVPSRPDVILDNLVEKIYSIGAAGGSVAEMIAAEKQAADDIRLYIASSNENALLSSGPGKSSPLTVAAYRGYPDVVAALLHSDLVKAHINDKDETGLTAWMAATFAMKQSEWTCNPAVLEDPFKFTTMVVAQPYYLHNPEHPYQKARELLEQAGAMPDQPGAKQIWLKTCPSAEDTTKESVQESTDLQTTLQQLGADDLKTNSSKFQGSHRSAG